MLSKLQRLFQRSSGICRDDVVGHVAAFTLTQVRLWIQNQFLVCGDSFVLCQWFSGKMEWRNCIWFSIVEFSLMITSPV